MSDQTVLRDQVYTRLLLKKVATEFSFNDFTVRKTWLPRESLENFEAGHPGGIVYVIPMAYEDETSESRKNLVNRSVPVQVGYQKPVADVEDNSEIDPLSDFVDELVEAVEKEIDIDLQPEFSFSRTVFLKDENDTPYSFVMLRENFFEAYFTAYFNRPR